jgi:hypothetical protein
VAENSRREGARTDKAIVRALGSDDRYPRSVRRGATDLTASRCSPFRSPGDTGLHDQSDRLTRLCSSPIAGPRSPTQIWLGTLRSAGGLNVACAPRRRQRQGARYRRPRAPPVRLSRDSRRSRGSAGRACGEISVRGTGIRNPSRSLVNRVQLGSPKWFDTLMIWTTKHRRLQGGWWRGSPGRSSSPSPR